MGKQKEISSKDFSEYNGPGTELRKAQLRMLEILQEVDRICNKYNIPYWIDAGTLLGAIRHGGFIPWDDDIDIVLLRDDYLRLINILPQELPEQFVTQNAENEEHFHMVYSRVVDKNSFSDYGDDKLPIRRKFKYQGLFLDLFFIERGFLPVKQGVTRVHYYLFRRRKRSIGWKFLWVLSKSMIALLRATSYFIPAQFMIFGYGIPFYRSFRKDEIFPVKPISFEGCTVMGPSDPHSYLQRQYGDYMTLPPKTDRVTHARRIEVY